MVQKRRLTFIEQMEASECGLACLAMVMNFYKIQITLPELRDEYGSTKEGLTFQNLFMLAHEKEMLAKAFKIEKEDLWKASCPAILHWENNHFVVLEKIKNGKYIIVDPVEGRKKLSFAEIEAKFTGFLMNIFPREITDKIIEKKKKKKILIQELVKEKKFILFICMVTLILQCFAVITPIGTKWFTDEILISQTALNLVSISVFLTALFIVYLSTTLIRSWLISKLQKHLDGSIMNIFMNRLFRLPIQFFENRASGDLLFRANSNVYIRQVLSTTSVTVLIDIILVLTYTGIMIYYSIELSIYLFLIALIIALILIVNTRILKKLNERNISSQTKVQSFVSESINGILDVKVHGLEEKTIVNWQELFHKQLQDTFNLNLWNGTIQSLTSTIQFIIPLFVYGIGSYYVFSNQITIGTLIAFGTISVTFITPIISISNSYSQIFVVKSYFQRILDVIESKPEQNKEVQSLQKPLTGDIRLSNVSFNYSRYGKKILKNINLSIKAGQTVAIVGESGSGKSTLIKLLLGLYYATEGQVLFDNHDIKEYDISFLRNQIGSVLQEAKLLNRTIKENLTLYHEDVLDEELFNACNKANILDDILALPLNFKTIISEQGLNFSAGQRQRFHIARTLIRPKPILVFDEATSALDTISEQLIDRQIRELSCTRIIVAHRLSTVQHADCIHVLSKGEIVESGTHKELLKKQGEYFRLFEKTV